MAGGRLGRALRAAATVLLCMGALAGPMHASAAAPHWAPGHVRVATASRFARSAPLRSLQAADQAPIVRRALGTAHFSRAQLARLRDALIRAGFLAADTPARVIPLLRKRPALARAPAVLDRVRQTQAPMRAFAASTFTTPIASFDGLGASTGTVTDTAPPDTDIATGTNEIVEIVNSFRGGKFQVFDKTGKPVSKRILLENLWANLGGPCSKQGLGDNVVIFDQLAERYLITQLAGEGVPTQECVAVSETGDPLGAYYLYDFAPFPGGDFNDYPKIALWPDAYYLSFNLFNGSGSEFLGAGFVALDRAALLAGDPDAKMVAISGNGEDLAYSVLPASLDGQTPPPAGAPGLFADFVSPFLWGKGTPYALELWQMHVDWANPIDSSVSGPSAIDVAAFNDGLCGGNPACIPQPAPGEGLDSLSDRLMFRLAYRNGLGADGHQALVVNQTVGENSANPPTGVRWYELDAPAGSIDPTQWSVAQESTFAPSDGASRWMGSIAMDRAGDLALGYSLSSTSTDPSVVYTGRLASDPPGEMSEPETTLVAGAGVQVGTRNRWGDYSSMVLDPLDDCTFWYAQEYYASTGPYLWSTHIGAFRFASCVPGASGTLTGTVTDAATGAPLAGASVTLGPNDIVAVTDQNGAYSLALPAGDYTASAGKLGYLEQSAPVSISAGTTTTLNVALATAPTITVSGTVTDAGHGYGLYAELKVTSAIAGEVADVWTDPTNGDYRMSLPAGADYTVSVFAYQPGFTPGNFTLTDPTVDTTQNVALDADPSCSAPGYGEGIGADFDGDFPPAGWTVTNAVAGSPVLWRINTAWQEFNITGGAAQSATIDALRATILFNYTGAYDSSLVSAPIAVTSLPPNPTLQFELNSATPSNNALDVDISDDGGSTWQNLAHYVGYHGTFFARPGVLARLPLTIPNGTSEIELRWRLYGPGSTFEPGYAQIDNVALGTCHPLAGGLLVGTVRAKGSGIGLIGAKVAYGDGAQEQTRTFKNRPADPNLARGFYLLFVGTGAGNTVTLTAADSAYAPAATTVTVATGAITRADFTLGMAQFAATPTAFNLHVTVGSKVTKVLSVANSGTEAGEFRLLTFNAPPASSAPGQAPTVPLAIIHCRHLSPLAPGATPRASGCSAPPGGAALAMDGGAQSGSAWQPIAPFPEPTTDDLVASDDATGKLYVISGFDGLAWDSQGYVYDPQGDAWSAISDYGPALFRPAAAFFNGKLYVAFGWADSTGGIGSRLRIYDAASDSWSLGPDAPTLEGGGVAAAVVGGKIYFVGGCNRVSACGSSAVEFYDPAANSWSTVASYPHPVGWASCGGVDGKLYCAGGIANGSAYADAYVYDPAANAWSPIPDLPIGTGGLWGSAYAGTPLGLVVSGGVTDNSTAITNQAFLYDPTSAAWVALPNVPESVYEGGGACGFYQVGGSIGTQAAPVPFAAHLAGYAPCTTSSIPWLTLAPASGTVAVGHTATVALTFDGAGRSANSTSTAYLVLRGAGPAGPEQLPLTVHWDALPIDLAVSAKANPSTVSVGDSLRYSVTVTNLNEQNHGAATGTTLTAYLSSSLTNPSESGPASCKNNGSNQITCDFGTLALGASATETFSGVASAAGSDPGEFYVAAQETDSDTSNNEASASVDVLASSGGGTGGHSGGGGGGGGGTTGIPALLLLLAAAGLVRVSTRRSR